MKYVIILISIALVGLASCNSAPREEIPPVADNSKPTIYINPGKFDTKLFDDAIQYYEKQLASNPNNPTFYYNLGIIYDEHLDNPSKAIFYYNKYLELAPDAPDREKVKKWIEGCQKRLKNGTVEEQDNQWLLVRAIQFDNETGEILNSGQELVHSGDSAVIEIRSSENNELVDKMAITGTISGINSWSVYGKWVWRSEQDLFSYSWDGPEITSNDDFSWLSGRSRSVEEPLPFVWTTILGTILTDKEAIELKSKGRIPPLKETNVKQIGEPILNNLRSGKPVLDNTTARILKYTKPDGYVEVITKYVSEMLSTSAKPYGAFWSAVEELYDYWNEYGTPQDALNIARIINLNKDDDVTYSENYSFKISGLETEKSIRVLENIGIRYQWKGMGTILIQWLDDRRVFADIQEKLSDKISKPIATVLLSDRAVRHIQVLSGEPAESFGLYDIEKEWTQVIKPSSLLTAVFTPSLMPNILVFQDQKQREFGIAKAKEWLETNKDRFK